MTVWINRRTGVMHRNRSCLALEHVLPRLLRPERFDPNRPRRRCSSTRCSASRRLRTLVAAVALRRGFVCGTSTCAMRRWAIDSGTLGPGVDPYVIPMARKQTRRGERDDRVIWRTVKRVGERVGIDFYPHSVRAAFAVNFLEAHPGELEALQALMGHSKIETTQTYLRPAEPRPSNGACPRPFLGRPPVRGLPRKGDERIRTAVRGFAGLCLTTRPRRPGRAW